MNVNLCSVFHYVRTFLSDLNFGASVWDTCHTQSERPFAFWTLLVVTEYVENRKRAIWSSCESLSRIHFLTMAHLFLFGVWPVWGIQIRRLIQYTMFTTLLKSHRSSCSSVGRVGSEGCWFESQAPLAATYQVIFQPVQMAEFPIKSWIIGHLYRT